MKNHAEKQNEGLQVLGSDFFFTDFLSYTCVESVNKIKENSTLKMFIQKISKVLALQISLLIFCITSVEIKFWRVFLLLEKPCQNLICVVLRWHFPFILFTLCEGK
ncbi:MAG: hypothetical protein ACYDEC_15080 [Bacteroidia bacterium]